MKTRRSTSTGFRGKRGPERSAHRKAADAAGMSRDQLYNALALASMSDAEFDAHVEGENPPTLTELIRIAQNKPRKASAAPVVHVCPHCGGTL